MGRSNNVGALHYSALTWSQDALVVAFAVMKNDRAGSKAEELSKHIYANPLMPYICPILALAIFISINGYNPSGFLFTSHVAATDRFGKVFKKILTFLRVIHEYIDACLDDIASHSGRKV